MCLPWVYFHKTDDHAFEILRGWDTFRFSVATCSKGRTRISGPHLKPMTCIGRLRSVFIRMGINVVRLKGGVTRCPLF